MILFCNTLYDYSLHSYQFHSSVSRWEYYSMIYVRSNNSIRLFPRASLALFLLYHFYLFSSPSGFHLLALLVLFLFLTALMVSKSEILLIYSLSEIIYYFCWLYPYCVVSVINDAKFQKIGVMICAYRGRYFTIIYYTMVYYTILYNTVLYYAILYYTMLY